MTPLEQVERVNAVQDRIRNLPSHAWFHITNLAITEAYLRAAGFGSAADHLLALIEVEITRARHQQEGI